MITRCLPFLSMASLALCAMLSVAAHAQQIGSTAPAPSAWNSDNFDRQEFREEMVELRKEHEDIEATHEQLQSQCHAAQASPMGADLATCEQQRQALRERRENLHQRVHALHEKMAAARAAHDAAVNPAAKP